MSNLKRYDYRTRFKNMSLQELKDILPHLQEDYDKWFISLMDDEMIKSRRTLFYVKRKINKLTNDASK
jgi:uncharacterized protein YeeX (DUF496 family)|tara:strand:- start:865 stop:1068 length:204 start_codon:yes stop_codon:yes gene_type:complete